jgi:hypothetical protein
MRHRPAQCSAFLEYRTGYFLQKETKATKGDRLTVGAGWLGRRPPSLPSLTYVRKSFRGDSVASCGSQATPEADPSLKPLSRAFLRKEIFKVTKSDVRLGSHRFGSLKTNVGRQNGVRRPQN